MTKNDKILGHVIGVIGGLMIGVVIGVAACMFNLIDINKQEQDKVVETDKENVKNPDNDEEQEDNKVIKLNSGSVNKLSIETNSSMNVILDNKEYKIGLEKGKLTEDAKRFLINNQVVYEVSEELDGLYNDIYIYNNLILLHTIEYEKYIILDWNGFIIKNIDSWDYAPLNYKFSSRTFIKDNLIDVFVKNGELVIKTYITSINDGPNLFLLNGEYTNIIDNNTNLISFKNKYKINDNTIVEGIGQLYLNDDKELSFEILNGTSFDEFVKEINQ